MELGFETIGNAIINAHDKKPVLVTDPWVDDSAYFGSWTQAHQIPAEQLEASPGNYRGPHGAYDSAPETHAQG